MRYEAHETLVAPARSSSEPVRLMAGLSLTLLLFFLFTYVFSFVLGAFVAPPAREGFNETLEVGTTPVSVLINLYLFILIVVALGIAVRQVHARSLASLVGPIPRAMAQFRRVCLYLLGLHLAISVLVPSPPGLVPQLHLAPVIWLAYLPLALPAVLIQSSAEELVFRGYLQSQLAAYFKKPLIWLLVPSVLFGLLHHDSLMQGDNAWLVVGWAVAFGVAAADLTARSGTLGPAIALHFMNNVVAILLAAPQDNFDGLALFTFPFGLDDASALWAWAPVDLMTLFCGWLTARLALRR